MFAGGVDTGWTFYTPLSSNYAQGHVVAVVIGIFISGFSTIATGLNFIVTIHRLRAPGLTWYRLPLFIWSLYSTSVILVLATPVLAITLLLLRFERLFHVGVFDPGLGGDPLLFQHLFWFYSHPAVYIMILPGMGVVSEIIPLLRPQGVVRLQVHRLFERGHRGDRLLRLGPPHVRLRHSRCIAGVVFSLLSFFVAVPSAIKVFNWIGTLHKGSHPFRCADALRAGLHRPVHHRRPDRLVPRGARGWTCTCTTPTSSSRISTTSWSAAWCRRTSAALHYWWPKMTGRMYPEMWARAAALLMFIGFNLTFFPQYHPRLSRHAAALPRLSAGVPGAERAVLRRRIDPRGCLPDCPCST